MAPTTRLDVLVKLRERDEEKAERAVADAQRAALAARARLTEAQALARTDARGALDVASWGLVEAAHGRAREEAERAARLVKDAQARETEARSAHVDAHRRTEAVRRAADGRRVELVREAETRDQRRVDDLTTMLFSYRLQQAG